MSDPATDLVYTWVNGEDPGTEDRRAWCFGRLLTYRFRANQNGSAMIGM